MSAEMFRGLLADVEGKGPVSVDQSGAARMESDPAIYSHLP
jgi:hypothetical protein